jgi:hypothetical protein
MLDLPFGGTETYCATGIVPFGALGPLVNKASVSPPPDAPADPTPLDDTATVETPIVSPPGVTACCQISAFPFEGGGVVKTFVLRNGGPAVQGDDPGPEFEDTLPAGLTLVDAKASSGTIATVANTVSWNGSIAVGEIVTIEITATIDAGTAGSTICNPATVLGSPIDACCCCVTVSPGPIPPIPVLSGPALAALILLLAALAVTRLRRASAG